MISIVVPLYNEKRNIKELHKRILKTLKRQKDLYEIIFIDDGSNDGTWDEILKLSPVKGICLQKNYGQTPALDIGIHCAKGDIIVLLDGDLQNDPEEISLLLDKIYEGYDAVVGWRKKRYDHWARIFFSRISNALARFLLGIKIHDFGCGLKAYRSKFIQNYRLWGEAQVFLPAIAKERGARVCEVPVAHHPRKTGHSKIKISNLIKGAFDLISVVFFIKYFFKPLRFFGGFGALSVFSSLLIFSTAIILKMGKIRDFTETPLPLIGALLAIMGMLLFMMGLLAEILLRIYYEVTQQSSCMIKDIKEDGKKDT